MIEVKYIVEPLIGTLIGFGTNFIAVKMLFRPYKPVKIGKFTLPFTPGVIPKRKEKLAGALGKTIGNQVFTKNDIQDIFLSETTKNVVIEMILREIINDEVTLKEIALKGVEEEKYNQIKEKLERKLSQKIVNGILSIDIGNIIATEGVRSIKEKLKGNFLGNFISDDKIYTMAKSAGDKIEEYIQKNGEDAILPQIENEIENIEENTIMQIMEKNNLTVEKLTLVIGSIYEKIVKEKMNGIFDSFDISKVIEEKVSQMDVKEIEKLFMSVMKKELNAIVNLGAVLGFLLGCINIFL